MMLTPIPREHLADALDRFAVRLDEPDAHAAFATIRATACERAAGALAEAHRQAALAFARGCGMAVHPPGRRPGCNWDGAALDGDTEAYVILHEVAHFVLAPPERRGLVDFGLGPGPDTTERAAAERAAAVPLLECEADEAAASLLGILWEAALGQPALASFLDQNWLEALDRSAPAHFTAVLHRLTNLGIVDPAARAKFDPVDPPEPAPHPNPLPATAGRGRDPREAWEGEGQAQRKPTGPASVIPARRTRAGNYSRS